MATTTRTRRKYSVKRRREMLREVDSLLDYIAERVQVTESSVEISDDIWRSLGPAREAGAQNATDTDFSKLEKGLNRLQVIADSLRPMDSFRFQILSEELRRIRALVPLNDRCFKLFFRYGTSTRPYLIKEILRQLPALRQQAEQRREERLEELLANVRQKAQLETRRLYFLQDQFAQGIALGMPRHVHWLLFEPLDRTGRCDTQHLMAVERAFDELDRKVEAAQRRTPNAPATSVSAGRARSKAKKAAKSEDDKRLRASMKGSGGASGDNAKQGLSGGNTRNAKRRHRRHGVAA